MSYVKALSSGPPRRSWKNPLTATRKRRFSGYSMNSSLLDVSKHTDVRYFAIAVAPTAIAKYRRAISLLSLALLSTGAPSCFGQQIPLSSFHQPYCIDNHYDNKKSVSFENRATLFPERMRWHKNTYVSHANTMDSWIHTELWSVGEGVLKLLVHVFIHDQHDSST